MRKIQKKAWICMLAVAMLFIAITPFSIYAQEDTSEKSQDTTKKVSEESGDETKETDTVTNDKRSIENSKQEEPSTYATATDPSWFIFNGETITGYSSSSTAPKAIVIPSSYVRDGTTYQITAIGDNAFAGQQLTSVVLNDQIKTIGTKAFYNNQNITTISIPNSVTSIGASAFENCITLETLTLSSQIKTISSGAFKATAITRVVIPSGITTISASTFENCRSLSSVTLPDGLVSIGSKAFYYCPFNSITLPDSLKTINNTAFTNTKLSKITIPNQVTSIGDMAFYSCTSLAEVTIGEAVQTIGSNAFALTRSGIKIRFQNKQAGEIAGAPWGANNASIYWYAEDSSSFYIDSKGNVLGFKPLDHSSLPTNDPTNGHTIASIPTKINGINVTGIAESAFTGSNLTEVTLPEGITTINNNAFFLCRSLKTVNIPNSLKDVKDYAFEACERLSDITFGTGIQNIAKNAFGSTSRIKFRLYSKKLNEVQNAPWGCTNAQIYWKSEDTSGYYAGDDGVLYGFKPLDHASLSGVEDITANHTIANIPEKIGNITINKIGDHAFDGVALTSMSLPSTVSEIGEYAFAYANLSEVVLPNSIRTLGQHCFYYNSRLKKVILPKNLKKIPESAFSLASLLTEIELPSALETIDPFAFSSTGLTSITIPNSVKEIGYSAFNNTKLTNVRLPDTITDIPLSLFQSCTELTTVVLPANLGSIQSQAFSGCSKLSDIHLPSTVTYIGENVFSNCASLTSLNLHEGIQALGKYAILGTNITELTIPSTMKSMDAASLEGYKGTELYVHQPRSGSPISSTQPWGSGVAKEKIFYDGEYTSITDTVSYNTAYNQAAIHLRVDAQSGSVISSIILPDGTKKSNIDQAAYEFDYTVTMNGDYTFTSQAQDGTKSEHTVHVDRIVYARLDAHDFSLPYSEVSSLTTANIIQKAEAKGYKNSDNSSLTVSLKTSVTTIKSALNADGKSVKATFSVTTTTPDGKEDVTVDKSIMIYTAKEFTVTFKDYNGTNLKIATVYEGDDAVPPSDPTRSGYTFTGWDTPFTDIRANTTVTAQYSAKSYTVKYNTNGGTPSSISSKSVHWEDANLLPSTTPTRTNYTFNSWKLLSTTTVVTNTTTYNTLVANDTVSSITLQAQWTPINYQLTFDKNGGVGTDKNPITFNADNKTVNVGSNPFTKEGCTFEGWNTKQDGTGTMIKANTSYTPPLANTTLYAQWKEQTATYYVSIPKEIILKNEKDSDYASATESIGISQTAAGDGTLSSSKRFEIRTESTSVTLTNAETSDTYKVAIYDANGKLYEDTSEPLMTLQNVGDEKEKTFTLKTAKNLIKKRTFYEGTLTFFIRFGG